MEDRHTCFSAKELSEMREDIGEMRGDIRGMTTLIAEYVKRLDASLVDHEDRLRTVEGCLAQMAGRDKTLGVLKDILLGVIGAVLGLIAGRGAM